jgi:hypothetical protein
MAPNGAVRRQVFHRPVPQFVSLRSLLLALTDGHSGLTAGSLAHDPGHIAAISQRIRK